MIEDYIEKDIVRRVKIVQYFFDVHTINFVEVANRLNVTSNTIKADCEKIRLLLEQWIARCQYTTSDITLIFSPKVSRYQLVRIIYSDSRFLNVCARYICGDTDYLSIVEEEFVSVTKSFAIKKQVEKFFKETLGGWPKIEASEEIKYRFLIVSICMRSDFLMNKLDSEKLELADCLARKILSKFLNQAVEREYSSLQLIIYFSFIRSEKNRLSINEEDKEYIYTGLIFNQIEEVIKNSELSLPPSCLNEEEIMLISVVYRNLSYNPPSYIFLEVDYKYQKDRLMRNFKSLDVLVDLIEIEFKVHLRGNIIFERSFFNLMYFSKWQLNCFFLERFRYLSKKQLEVKDRLVSILQKWENYCEGVVPHFTEVNLENFCIRVSPIVIPEELTELSPLLIVAEDSYSHVCYREKLKLWLSSECVSIDDRLYYSLEEIPSYYFNRDCIIVCEKSLLNLKVPIGKGTIFPIANNSILDDIKSIIVSIYEKKAKSDNT